MPKKRIEENVVVLFTINRTPKVGVVIGLQSPGFWMVEDENGAGVYEESGLTPLIEVSSGESIQEILSNPRRLRIIVSALLPLAMEGTGVKVAMPQFLQDREREILNYGDELT